MGLHLLRRAILDKLIQGIISLILKTTFILGLVAVVVFLLEPPKSGLI